MQQINCAVSPMCFPRMAVHDAGARRLIIYTSRCMSCTEYCGRVTTECKLFQQLLIHNHVLSVIYILVNNAAWIRLLIRHVKNTYFLPSFMAEPIVNSATTLILQYVSEYTATKRKVLSIWDFSVCVSITIKIHSNNLYRRLTL